MKALLILFFLGSTAEAVASELGGGQAATAANWQATTERAFEVMIHCDQLPNQDGCVKAASEHFKTFYSTLSTKPNFRQKPGNSKILVHSPIRSCEVNLSQINCSPISSSTEGSINKDPKAMNTICKVTSTNCVAPEMKNKNNQIEVSCPVGYKKLYAKNLFKGALKPKNPEDVENQPVACLEN